ncbi:hypothetical protein MYX07_01290 [Patescibacteria group bacterium AH-259-L07]|nr:hypothetical protein [Patescibacteria group bacterium AH-259-L07]
MKYQVYMRGITADIKGPPPPHTDDFLALEQAIAEIREKAIQAVGIFPIELVGEPMYVGSNIWLVPFSDAPIGEPIDANSAEEAIAKIEKAGGWMDKDLRAEPVADA